MRVDDDVDVLANVQDTEHLRNQGIDIIREQRPARDGQIRDVHFARMDPRPGESTAALKARVQPWVDSIRVPAETRLMLMELDRYDPDTATTAISGLRTVLLRGPALFGTADVAQATVEQNADGAAVNMTLSPDASTRFEEATAEWQSRRIAIVVDGVVSAAPMVRSKIAGGKVSVTMGGSSPDGRRAGAMQLATRLNAKVK